MENGILLSNFPQVIWRIMGEITKNPFSILMFLSIRDLLMDQWPKVMVLGFDINGSTIQNLDKSLYYVVGSAFWGVGVTWSVPELVSGTNKLSLI